MHTDLAYVPERVYLFCNTEALVRVGFNIECLCSCQRFLNCIKYLLGHTHASLAPVKSMLLLAKTTLILEVPSTVRVVPIELSVLGQIFMKYHN